MVYEVHLNGQFGLVWWLMNLQLEPKTTLAPFGLVLEQPHPFDVGIIFMAYTANHSVNIQGFDNVGLLFGSFTSFLCLAEKWILKKKRQICEQRKRNLSVSY